MFKIMVCLLIFNLERLLCDVILFFLKIVDEIVIVDFGSIDNILYICQSYGLLLVYKKYGWYGEQMNYVVLLVSYDWVLCIDSDEIFDLDIVDVILKLKRSDEFDSGMVWWICCYWYVLGEKV